MKELVLQPRLRLLADTLAKEVKARAGGDAVTCDKSENHYNSKN